MMKRSLKALTLSLASFAVAVTAVAGDPKAPLVEDPTCVVPFYGSVSFGYDTSYLFRGGRLGDHAPWAGIDLNYDINDKVTFNIGAWYINPTENPVVNDELDLYAYVIFPAGPFEVALGGTWFYFAEDSADEGELNAILTLPLGDFCNLNADYVYDVTFEANYFGLSADKTIPLSNCLDLNLEAGASWGDDRYNFIILGGDNAWVKGGITWHMTETADFGAYILGNFPYDDLQAAGEDDDVYGGASISVAF